MLRILLIDDNPDDRLLVMRELHREFAELEVEQVIDDPDFQKAMANRCFDLVITDYQLLWSDGLTLLRIIKARYPDCPVIMFTNSGSQEVAVDAMKSGLDDYVIKSPSHYIRLALAVRAVLERVETNRRVSHLENRLQSLLNRLNIGVFRATLEGQFLEGNGAFLRLLGAETLSAAQSLDLPLALAQPGQTSPQIQELCLHCADSTVRWVSLSEMLNTVNEAVVIEGLLEDISVQKQAQIEKEALIAALEAERARLNTVLWNLPAGVIIAEAPSGKLILGNEQVAQVWRHAFLPANTVDEYIEYRGFHLDDGRPYQPEEWPLARSLTTGEIVQGEEIEILRGDNTRGIIYASSAPIRDTTGKIVAGVVTFADITVQKRAEQAQALLAEASRVLASSLEYETILQSVAQLTVPLLADFCLIDMVAADGSVQRLVTAHSQPEKAAVIHNLLHRYPPDPSKPHPVFKILQSGEPQFLSTISDDLLQAIAHDSEHLQILREVGMTSAMCLPLQTRGQVLGVISFISTDLHRSYQIQERRLAEDLAHRIATAVDNARLYQKAQEANRMKDEFLAVLSHELRSPLNSMLGWAQLLQARQLDPATAKRGLEVIERNARLQTQLIEDLLDISRIIQGKLRLNLQPLQVGTVIETALQAVAPTATAKNIQLQFIPQANVGRILGDSDRLQQVIWNLLSNAIKFTPEGGQVSVRLEQAGDKTWAFGDKTGPMRPTPLENRTPNPQPPTPNPHSSACAQITVTDTGQGIDPEFLPYVFDRFRQADSSTTRSFGGLGLGLSIVQQLVEMHGGTVQVFSPGENQGATFTIKLPLLEASQLGTQGAPSTQNPDSPPLPLASYRILVVDDELDTRECMTVALCQYGAEVTAAASVLEALQALETNAFDILVSDIGMPNEDGYVLLQKLRSIPTGVNQAIPAIALTAYAGEEVRQQALSVGFQEHLPKPVELEKLVTKIIQIRKK